MTTVLNPTSSPTVIYNTEGRNIQFITVNPDDGFIPIPYVSGETVCVVTVVGPLGSYTDGVMLPAGCAIGDTVEIYVTNILSSGGPFLASMPAGEMTVYGYETADTKQSRKFMKVSPTTWVGSIV